MRWYVGADLSGQRYPASIIQTRQRRTIVLTNLGVSFCFQYAAIAAYLPEGVPAPSGTDEVAGGASSDKKDEAPVDNKPSEGAAAPEGEQKLSKNQLKKLKKGKVRVRASKTWI